MISYEKAAAIMKEVFSECQQLRDAGQKEYAHDLENALANFERVASLTGQTREQVLFTYMYKHIDGISAWISGHQSQRESVKGRINDAIVYLCLLRSMVEDREDQRV